MFRLLLALLSLTAVICANCQSVRLSEFMGVNQLLPDSNNVLHPWVELENNSTNVIDLAGYKLSIDTVTNTEWTFPAVQIGPGEFIVVYFGSEVSSFDDLHSNLSITASTRYIALLGTSSKDILSFPFLPNKNETIGRNPWKPIELIHYRADQVTRGLANYRP